LKKHHTAVGAEPKVYNDVYCGVMLSWAVVKQVLLWQTQFKIHMLPDSIVWCQSKDGDDMWLGR